MMDKVEAVAREKIKPCPFCGGEIYFNCTSIACVDNAKDICSAICSNEDCSCKLNFSEDISLNDAIKAWNTRTQAAIEAMEQWLPIDTAPKDTKIMLWVVNQYVTDHVCVGFIQDDGIWYFGDDGEGVFSCLTECATHWMPLPQPPQENNNDN